VTTASKITIARILLVPAFALLAVAYGRSVIDGSPTEAWRWAALSVFVLAATTDGVDGWVARHFNQRSDFGAFIDPIADKALLLTGVIVLSLVDWGVEGWRLPLWFALVVILRDVVILAGIGWLKHRGLTVRIRPHWLGKVCTVSQMFALGWVMLKLTPFPPDWPCAVAAVLTTASGIEYVRRGLKILRGSVGSI
jgi:CDP-diacylglycerol--glycerol-3-phosphate 3-phosphatidyltransferase